ALDPRPGHHAGLAAQVDLGREREVVEVHAQPARGDTGLRGRRQATRNQDGADQGAHAEPSHQHGRTVSVADTCAVNASSPLVLASRSPQRRSILAEAGFEFEVVTADLDEATEGEPEAVAVE